jgi:hypothetical protein
MMHRLITDTISVVDAPNPNYRRRTFSRITSKSYANGVDTNIYKGPSPSDGRVQMAQTRLTIS